MGAGLGSDRVALLRAVVQLGRAFRERGMGMHARALRLYWLAVRHGLASGDRAVVKVEWNSDAVIEWLKVLRVPPWEGAYPVRPRGSSCRRCPRGDGHPVETTTLLSFGEGAKMGCRRCGDAWLELESPPASPNARGG